MGLGKQKIRERDAVERKLEVFGLRDLAEMRGLRGKECGERGGVRALNWGCRSIGGLGQGKLSVGEGEGGASSRGNRFQ